MAAVTLQGGNSTSLLYYSSATSVGYLASKALDSDLQSQYPLSDIQTDTTLGGSSGTDTASSQPVLLVTNNNAVTAINYDAVIEAAAGPYTLDISNSTGNTSVLASGSGQIFLTDNSNVTIAGGDGNFWIGHSLVGATGTMDVTLGNGNDTVNDLFGASTIETGSGNSVINLYEGTSNITFAGGGQDTVNAGVEGSTYDVGDVVNVTAAGSSAEVLISENLADVSFTNGSGNATIRGGNGSTTINAGGTGAVLYSAESYDFFIGTASPSTLSDMVTDNSTSNDTLIAGAGTTTVNATGSTGTVLIVSGTGDSTLEGGSGSDTFEIGALSAGSHSITIDNWTSSDSLVLQGFAGISSEITYGTATDGDVTATLSDGTVITFTGITDSSDISTHVTL